MHDIIFAKEIPYSGKESGGAADLKSFLANPNPLSALNQDMSLSDRLSFDLTDLGWRLVQTPINNPGSPYTPPGAPSQTAFCASGSQALIGIDPNLLRDLQNGSTLSPSTQTLNANEIAPSRSDISNIL